MKIQRFSITAAALLLAMVAVCGAFSPKLYPIFKTNIPFNTAIALLVFFGAGLCLRNLYQLMQESKWFTAFQNNQVKDTSPAPKVLLPLKTAFIDNDLTLTPATLKTCLESIGNRLSATRTYSRYLVSLPIIVGLLGTFWGLSLTIGSISHMIGAMPQEMNVEFFSLFKQGLQGPIDGMGIAFSSSLFGLAGSLLLGALELQVGSAYSHAYTEIENWLSAHMQQEDSLSDDPVSETFLKALVKKTADSVNKLAKTTASSEDIHADTNQLLATLSAQLATMAEQTSVEQQLLMKLAESQLEVQAVFRSLTQTLQIDESAKKYITNVEEQLHSLREELALGRQQAVTDICDELRMVTETLSVMNDNKLDRVG